MKLRCFLLVSIHLLCVSVLSDAGRSGAVVGGWTPIKNLKDPYVLEIANFAVTEYNKRYYAKLKLLSVVKGETQVVSGTNYRLVLKAKNDSAINNYEAVVWDRVWLHSRNLTSFKLLHS